MKAEDAEQIATLLESQFKAAVDVESSNGNGRYRFAVVSPSFSQMPQLDRQDAVWEAVSKETEQSVSIDISVIYTLSPEEFAESGGPV